jgi:hypothetical protein
MFSSIKSGVVCRLIRRNFGAVLVLSMVSCVTNSRPAPTEPVGAIPITVGMGADNIATVSTLISSEAITKNTSTHTGQNPNNPGLVCDPQLIDGVVARIDGHPIFLSMLGQYIALQSNGQYHWLYGIGKNAVWQTAMPTKLQQDAWTKELFELELIDALADDEHITVSKKEVDQSINALAKNNHLEPDAFQTEITNTLGVSWEAFQHIMHLQLTKQKWVQNWIIPTIPLTEQDRKLFGSPEGATAWQQKVQAAIEKHLLQDEGSMPKVFCPQYAGQYQ